MNKEIYDKRFLKSFTLAIIKVTEKSKFNIPLTKEIIDADLIPKLSNELMKKYLLNRILKEQLEHHESPKPLPQIVHPIKPQQRTIVQPKPVVPQLKKQVIQPPKDTTNGYTKIKPLIDDVSVSRIQCVGPNKPLIIIRSGQRQITKISLTKENIYEVFHEIAEIAHIPIIEGPIKIILHNLKLDGINSNIMESKFIIQKNTAYSLLEN